MIDFRKKALILTLAATVSVTGSFAADNYKNCLMDMEFKSTGNNEISLILNTKTPYEGNISPMRKDAGTFVIMLPETDSQAPTPDLSETGNCIQSVDVRKMPYANGSKGYTRILIKTAGVINLNTSTALYIPSEKSGKLPDRVSGVDDNEREVNETRAAKAKLNSTTAEQKQNQTTRERRKREIRTPEERNTELRTDVPGNNAVGTDKAPEQEADNNISEANTTDNIVNDTSGAESGQQKYLLGLLVVLIILASIYSYLKAQDKMANVQGEKLKIDIADESSEDDKKGKKRKNKHKISRTINELDNIYAKTSSYNMKPFIAQSDAAPKEQEEKINIVDLDELFKEKKSQPQESSNETNSGDSLDDFLSGFTFDDSELIENIENLDLKKQSGFDEEFYEKIMNSTSIKFSKEDIACFNELLQSEINDNVIQNIEQYAVSNPIAPQKPSTDKLLENILTEYAISQNITFSSEDTNIIRKLLSVEIDENFVKDLRTDPALTKKMEEEMKAFDSERRKPSEIVTLSVKDMLPDLSAAIKKQGNKPIRSEAKPETVYFSEGYEVSTLSVDIDLPDFSKEMKSKKAFDSQPSYYEDTVDLSYADSAEKLHITGLPDLKDAVAHPKKYEDKKVKEKHANEKELLNNILNVQFKPFDDGTRNFEIINNDEDEDETPTQTVDIEKEFSQFENFEVANTDEPEKVYETTENDDFERLFDQNYVDLDANKKADNAEEDKKTEVQTKELSTKKKKQKEKTEEFVLQNLKKAEYKIPERKEGEKSKILASMLEKINLKRKERKELSKENPNEKTPEKAAAPVQNNAPQKLVKCILDGVNYDIVNSAAIGENIGCHLGKSEKGYVVLAYEGEKLSIIKEYHSLGTEKLQARLSETLADGTPRYLIKIGLNKFIVDIKDNQVRYVMDL